MTSFNLKDSIFGNQLQIDNSAQIIFVADLFVEDYVGGAELTSEAIIIESPFKIQKIKSQDVTMDLLSQGVQKFWIFGKLCGT